MRKQELRFILQEMEKERNNNDFSLFRRIYTSEKRLNELCQNPVIRKKFKKTNKLTEAGMAASKRKINTSLISILFKQNTKHCVKNVNRFQTDAPPL